MSTGSSQNNRLANTKERDFSIGLDNHGFRYFDPETGRYISPDPIGFGGGVNWYVSSSNNPINHIDPLGLDDDDGPGLWDMFVAAVSHPYEVVLKGAGQGVVNIGKGAGKAVVEMGATVADIPKAYAETGLTALKSGVQATENLTGVNLGAQNIPTELWGDLSKTGQTFSTNDMLSETGARHYGGIVTFGTSEQGIAAIEYGKAIEQCRALLDRAHHRRRCTASRDPARDFRQKTQPYGPRTIATAIHRLAALGLQRGSAVHHRAGDQAGAERLMQRMMGSVFSN